MAQEFPLKNFMTVYHDKNEKYSLTNYQSDTTISSKTAFLKKLETIDKESFDNLNAMMGLNWENFPQEFLITDIDRNGKNEYFISENYEGVLHCNYIEENGRYTKFLVDIPYYNFLIENPEKIWLIAQDSYLGWERFELERMQSKVYLYNFITQNNKPLFKLYNAWQIPIGNDTIPYIGCVIPNNLQTPKYFSLTKNTRIYADFNMHNNYQNIGDASAKSTGWILSDSLNSYFVILDTNTRYINDSLGQSLITYKDKGYMMCWINKDNVEYPLENGINGTYKDNTTGEYLRFFETTNGLNIRYFTQKTFENNLRLVSFDKNEGKLIIKFNASEQTYKLEFKNNFKDLECVNPDSTKQFFYRQ